MKFFATVALISVVAAACEEGGDAICVAKEGDEDGQRCIKRVVTETPDAKKDKKYKAALKADATLAKDYVFYQCSFKADAATLVESSGKVDEKSKVTFTYEDLTPEEAAGSGAIMIKGAAFAAALGLISYM